MLLCYAVRVDLFFIDWEKPRGALVRTAQDHESGLGKGGVTPGLPGGASTQSHILSCHLIVTCLECAASLSAARFSPISVWRTLLAANEWAELQTQRRLKLPFVLIVLVCILEAGRVKYVATPQPNVYDLSEGEINPILQFANNVFWFLVVAGIQLLYTVGLGERYLGENPSSSFIDMCTVAKVSLLIVDEKYHGYYLHANAPHEHADGDMRELTEHLFEEASAMRLGRGLLGCPDPNCQTFELHLPAIWRDMYDRVFRRLVDSETASVEASLTTPQQRGLAGTFRMGGGGNTPTVGGQLIAGGAATPQGGAMTVTSIAQMSSLAKSKERTKRLGAAFGALNTFLKAFIEETDPDYKRVWRERTLMQQILDLPPDMVSEALMTIGSAAAAGGKVTYVMMDKAYRFERTIFRGIEHDLLIFDILVFCITDYFQQSPTIAAVVTFIVAYALVQLRTYLGSRNITYKTLIDGRFLK
jgi:meckelin